MPQEFHVGYRSPLVSAVAWLLMLGGVLGIIGYSLDARAHVGNFGARDLLAFSLVVCAALLAVATGHALLRRHEWGRQLSQALLLVLVLCVPAMPAITGVNLLFVLPAVVVSIALVWPIKALGAPSVKQEFA